MAKKKPAAMPKAPTIAAYKGFSSELKCYGDFQYEIGKHYVGKGEVVRCGSGGFHACEMPLDIWNYYGPATSRFAEVQMGGQIARPGEKDDTKIAAAEITIKAEVKLPEIIKRAVEWITAAAKSNVGQGYSGHAAATGDSGHAAATGDGGHAAATGCSGHAAATGTYGHAAATGDGGIAASLGIEGMARAAAGGAIMLAAWDIIDGKWQIVAVFASKVGENGIEAGKAYRLRKDGVPEEV